MSKVTNTAQCETCESGFTDDTNKARVKVICSAKEKTYYYGQCIQCDEYRKRKNND